MLQQEKQQSNARHHEKTDQADVEHHTMEMCSAQFRLTENTPLHQEPMHSVLGPFAINTAAAQEILQGNYVVPAEVDDYTMEFLQAIQVSAPLDPQQRLSCEITMEDFQQYWKKPKEQTLSSISGLHYGHYKAAATDDTLSEIHALMTELAVTGASPFARWEMGLSCMLEKTAGVIKMEKLQAILLMEADFNFFNELMFAGHMIHQAKLQDRIPMECYGSQKNHEAIDVAVNCRLFVDLLQQKRIPGAIASVNAESCYDCITHAAGFLCAQQLASTHSTHEILFANGIWGLGSIL
jgi:hypothetical protein